MNKICLFSILLIAFIFIVSCEKIDKIEEINFKKVKSSTYTGSQGWPKGWKTALTFAEVEVVVEASKIKSIKLTRFESGLGSKAKKIIDDIIKKQSLQVDTISGATVSSKCILKATEKALKKGLK